MTREQLRAARWLAACVTLLMIPLGASNEGSDGRAHASLRRMLQIPSFGPRWPWQFNAITRYISTPTAAGSFTVAGDAKGEQFVDGTLKAGLGFSTSTAVAVGRAAPKLDAIGVTTPRYDRPFVATQAFVTVPRLLGWTTFPTIGYGLAEGRGSVLSASNGYFVVGEIAYNGLSNSFGLSLSQAQSGSFSYPVVNPGNGLLGGQGFSGIEQIGGANSLTLLTGGLGWWQCGHTYGACSDPRTIQFAQGIAYPFNILTPGNPLTCTQTMINTAVSTWGDLGGPVRPTPRSQPLFLIPFCLEFFNWNTLDNFHMFLQDYLDYYYGYDQAYYEDYGLPGDLPKQARGPINAESRGPRTRSRRNQGAAAAGPVPGPVSATNLAANATNSTGPTCRKPDPTTPFLKSMAAVQDPYPEIYSANTTSTSSSTEPFTTAAAPDTPPLPSPDVQAVQAVNSLGALSRRGGGVLPARFATSTLTSAGFGGDVAGSGALRSAGAATAQSDGDATTGDAVSNHALPICSAPAAKSNLSLGINGTAPNGPIMLVARPPGQIFPLAFRSSPQPRPEDINALVILGQLVASQVQQLPLGRLNRGAADQMAKAFDSANQAASEEIGRTFRQAWNVTNQIARLGAQVALNTFLSSAGAILPWTRNLYNTSSSWYRAAASTSNRAVDQAIADLSSEQDVLGNLTGTLATALQELTLRMALGSAQEFTSPDTRACKLVFNKVDVNKDGKLEAIEIELAILQLYNVFNKRLPGWQDPPERDEIAASLKAYDKDGNGTLDVDEFVEFARSLMRSGPDMFFARMGKQTAINTAILPVAGVVVQKATAGALPAVASVPLAVLAPIIGNIFSGIRGLVPV